MSLKIAVVSESLFADDPRAAFLEGTLTARGDEVRSWRVPHGGAAIAQWATLGTAFQGVFAMRQRGELDLLCVSGGSRTMGLLGLLARPSGLEVVIDLALQGRSGHPADVAMALGATRMVARDLETYNALLEAGVPAYQAGITLDPPTSGPIEPRAKEPQTKGKVPVRITACDAGAVDVAIAEAVAAQALEPRVVIDLRVPEESLPFATTRAKDSGIVPKAIADDLPQDALVAWVIESSPSFSRRALQAAGEAMGLGVALLVSSPDQPREGAEHVDPANAAARIVALGKHKEERAELAARGRAWDEAYGYKAQSRLWLRAVDAACADKVAQLKKAKQAAVEGVKTGTRKT